MENGLTLKRVALRPEGAFGVLLHHGLPFAVTLERSFARDGKDVTKIPPGKWPCKRTVYLRGGYQTFEVLVPGHTRLLFHRGNVETDSEGCVLVGESFHEFGRGRPGIGQSAAGFAELMARVGDEEKFVLTVVACPCEPVDAL
jgi:hypothetical protein